MIIITQDTLKIFQQELELCASRQDSWKCIILKYSEIGKRNERQFSEILDKVSICLGEDGMRAFHFENGDIHFIMKYATQKAFAVLTEQLSKIIGHDIQNLIRLYEVKVDLEEIQEILREHSKKELPAIPEKIQDKENVPSKLAATLQIRRAKRTDISILVIEDDPFSLRLVQKTLGNSHVLHSAEDGMTGMEAYLMHAPDILFLDIGLPDINGLELMEKIFKADPQAFIVILSGNGNRENVLAAVTKGAKGFVAKPFTKEKLFQYIEKNPFQKRNILRG